MDACPMWPNQSAHARRPLIAMQRRAPNDLSALAACLFKQARAGPSHSRDAMARTVAVHGELAQPQGHCCAPQRATDLPGGSILVRWVRAPRAAPNEYLPVCCVVHIHDDHSSSAGRLRTARRPERGQIADEGGLVRGCAQIKAPP